MAIDRLVKSNSILKKLERYLPTTNHNKKRSPIGCFSVYVGPTRQKFVIKAESANHPLFRTLLEDAELEYGFENEGPLRLPCDVDLFCGVLEEMAIHGGDRLDRPDYYGPGYACCGPFLARSRASYGHFVQPCRLERAGNQNDLEVFSCISQD